MTSSKKDKKKVLVVEDNLLNAKLFRDILESQELEVFETADGSVVLDMLDDFTPNIIIMDIQLPNISGIDVIKDIKQNKKYKSIPIIAVTAYVFKEDRDKIMSAGCEDYIAKPIEIEEFLEIVNKYL